MRLLSSIIKGARIRDEAVIDLKRHQFTITDNKHLNESMNLTKNNSEDFQVHYDTDIILTKASQEAEEIVRNATRKANSIIQEALNTMQAKEEENQKYANEIIEEAHIKETAILEEAKIEAKKIIDEAQQKKHECILEAEQDMIKMIIDIAEHVISKELVDNNVWVGCLVRKMIDKENLSDEVEVFVSKEVYAKFTSEDIEKLSNDKTKVIIKEDESLNSTKIIVVTQQGNIEYDAKIGLEKVIHDIEVLQSL